MSDGEARSGGLGQQPGMGAVAPRLMSAQKLSAPTFQTPSCRTAVPCASVNAGVPLIRML